MPQGTLKKFLLDTREVYGKTHPWIGKQKVRKGKKMGQKFVQVETFLGTRNLKGEVVS